MKNRIEHKTSRTAEMICSIRASSFYENEHCLKTDDYIAPKLLPRVMIPLIKMKIMRTIIKNVLAPAGVYEYVIARTKFIDLLVLESLKNGFNQIVIIGAGFDSRAIRFCQKNPKAIFFELDAAITQTAKRNQLQKRKINIPRSVIFIPIDFNKESMGEMLEQHQFKKTEKTLFILEGITMYLEEEAIHHTFNTLRQISATHSLIVFDFIYKSILRREYTFYEEKAIHERYGEKSIYERVNKYNEAWRFGIEEGELNTFIEEFGLKLLKTSTAKNLEQEYGFGTHRINGTHCIAVAEVP